MTPEAPAEHAHLSMLGLGRALTGAGLPASVPLVVFFLVPLRGQYRWLGSLAVAVVLIALVPLTVHRYRAISHAEHPGLLALQSLVLILATLVTGFSAAYVLLADEGQIQGLSTRIDALYFTIVTLSTVGFGDITPTGQGARVVVAVQILANLTFVAVVIRLFSRRAGEHLRSVQVGLETRPPRRRRRRDRT